MLTFFTGLENQLLIRSKQTYIYIKEIKYENKICKQIFAVVGDGWSYSMCLWIHLRWKLQWWHKDNTIIYYACNGIMNQGR